MAMTEDLKRLYVLMLSGYHAVNSIEVEEYWLSIFLVRPLVAEGKMVINDSQICKQCLEG